MGIITLFTGLLVILAGIFTIANTGSTVASIAFILGITVILLGIVMLIGYFIGSRYRTRIKHNWVLVDSIVAIIIGVVLLGNLVTAEIVVPYLLAMWVIYSGIQRVVAATHIDLSEKKTNFIAALGIGLLLTVVGCLSFFNPLLSLASQTELIGMFLIVQGIAAVELGINSPHSKKKVSDEISNETTDENSNGIDDEKVLEKE